MGVGVGYDYYVVGMVGIDGCDVCFGVWSGLCGGFFDIEFVVDFGIVVGGVDFDFIFVDCGIVVIVISVVVIVVVFVVRG